MNKPVSAHALLNAAAALVLSILLNTFSMQATTLPADTVRVAVKTTAGDFTIALYNDTPKHRDNFVKLVNEDFYNGLLFHRVIADFMVQTGDPDSRNATPGQMLGAGDPGYEIDAEILCPQHINSRGALAAARTGDQINPMRRSSGSQFYIVTGRRFTDAQIDMMERRSGITYSPEQREVYKNSGGAPHLDGAYTVFGEVTEGLPVIEKIEKARTDRMDRPVDDIRIISMEIVK